MVGKVAFKFIVLGNRLAPLMLVAERLSNQKDRFGSTFLVVRETFQDSGALLDNLVVFLAFLGSGQGIFTIGNTVQSGDAHFTGLLIQPFRIEHVIQVGTAGTPLKYEGNKSQCQKTEHHSVKIQKKSLELRA